VPTRSTPVPGTSQSIFAPVAATSYLATFSDRLTGYLDDCRISGHDSIRVRAFFHWWSIMGTDDLLSLCGIELRVSIELHSSKQQDDIALKMNVASVCFSCFKGMLQGFHMDAAK
jgi:hypothetical protein